MAWLTVLEAMNPPHSENVEVLDARLVDAINQAASKTIPTTQPCSRSYKDAWYYNAEIKDVNQS